LQQEEIMKLSRRQVLAGASTAALAMPFVKRAWADDAVVNIYNWTDYIGETTLDDFTAATGIKVVYDTYTSAEEMEAKMLAGSTGYDVVDQAGLSLPRFIKAGVYEKLDRSKFPKWGNLDPEVLRILGGWDEGNQYAIPYMWGSVGITYNLDMVKERLPNADLTSLDTLFKPENIEKLADCGVSVLDSPKDVIPVLLRYLGKDGDTTNVEDYKAVVELFKPIRQYIKTFDNTNYLNAIPNKELCAINSWSGDYATARSRAKDAGVDINLAYFVPKTGAPAWVDTMCIPSDARHKENAYKFLDFMMTPEVVAKCTNFTNYANGNLASKQFVDPAVLNDPAVYPDAETMKALWALKFLNDEQEKAMTQAWQDIKSG
jgi:putrescine transport system substrate-binding protein